MKIKEDGFKKIVILTIFFLILSGMSLYSHKRMTSEYVENVDFGLTTTVDTLARAIQLKVQNCVFGLQQLARSMQYSSVNHEVLMGQMRSLASSHNSIIYMTNDEGQLIDWSGTGTKPKNMARTLRDLTRMPEGSSFYVYPGYRNPILGQRPMVATVPYFHENGDKGYFIEAVPIRDDEQALMDSLNRDGITTTLIDKLGLVVFRSRMNEKYVGTPGRPWIFEASKQNGSGLLETKMLTGHTSRTAYARERMSGWTIIVDRPTNVMQEPLDDLIWSMITENILSVIVAAVLLNNTMIMLSRKGLLNKHARKLMRNYINPLVWKMVSPLAPNFLEPLTEDELSSQNELVHALIEEAPCGIFCFAFDMTPLIWNDHCSKIFGYSRKEVASISFMDEICRREDRTLITELQDLMREKRRIDGYQIQFVLRDGRDASLLISGNVVRDKSGEDAATVFFIKDVSEQQSEISRQHHSARMEAMGRVAGGVVHDFNNILNVVSASIDLLRLSPNLSGRDYSLIDDILETTERGSELTARLLSFTRKRNDNSDLKVIDLGREVTGACNMLRRVMKDSADIVCKIGIGDFDLKCDRSQFEMMLFNLVNNSRDALKGRGRITVSLEKVSVFENSDEFSSGIPAGRHICVVVKDNGAGMDEEIAEKAIEPFFTTKEEGAGTGLGLSQAQSFARSHGGGMLVKSRTGKGTEISVFLPDMSETQNYVDPDRLVFSDEQIKKNITILIVDDHNFARNSLDRHLKLAGYNVLSAGDKSEAYDRLGSHGTIDVMVISETLSQSVLPMARLTKRGMKVLILSLDPDFVLPKKIDGETLILSGFISKASIEKNLTELLQ